MKTTCEFENYFEGYYSGELSPAEEIILQKHLLTCPTCPERIDKYYSVHSVLETYKRPTAEAELLNTYYQQVNLSYGQESFSQKLILLIYRLTSSRSPLFRVAQLIMLITVGIIAGWILFSSPEPQIIYQSRYPSPSSRPVGQADVEYVHYYLLTSEILLLDIENNKDDPDFFLDGELAQTLLHKTLRVREIALDLNNVKLLNLVSRMEMLLRQISNIQDDELNDFIGTIIKDIGLLEEINDVKNSLKLPEPKLGS
jgi:hypothetical protein